MPMANCSGNHEMTSPPRKAWLRQRQSGFRQIADANDAWVGMRFSDKGDEVLGRNISLFPTQEPQGDAHQNSHNADNEPYSIFNSRQKLTILMLSSASAFLSPTTASIFWPAMPEIASDLRVTPNDVNWTVTSYMVSASNLEGAFQAADLRDWDFRAKQYT